MIVGKVLAKRAFISPDREALIFNDRAFTYGLLNQRVNRLAGSLMDMGIKKGDRIGLLMYNSNEFPETCFALSKIGAVLVPLNTRLATPEMDFILADCEVTDFIYGRASKIPC
jgi:fatty-acyl-CoA synthase